MANTESCVTFNCHKFFSSLQSTLVPQPFLIFNDPDAFEYHRLIILHFRECHSIWI